MQHRPISPHYRHLAWETPLGAWHWAYASPLHSAASRGHPGTRSGSPSHSPLTLLCGDLPLLVCLIAFGNYYYGICYCCSRWCFWVLPGKSIADVWTLRWHPPRFKNALIWLFTVQNIITSHNVHIRFFPNSFWVCIGYRVLYTQVQQSLWATTFVILF